MIDLTINLASKLFSQNQMNVSEEAPEWSPKIQQKHTTCKVTEVEAQPQIIRAQSY